MVVWRDVSVRVIDHEATGAEARRVRCEAGVTLRVLSERTGLSVAYLSELERGSRRWTEPMYQQVLDALEGGQ